MDWDWLLQSIGVLLVLVSLLDVFYTVLYARSGTGLLTPFLNKMIWWIFGRLANLSSKYRNVILSYCGPVLMVTVAVFWLLTCLLGFTLILWPAMGVEIQASGGPTPTDFASAFYYAGYSFTTLGTGNLVPKTDFYRILMIVKAALGFSFFTLIITYYLSICDTLKTRNAYALTLHHKTRMTGEAKEYVVLMTGTREPEDIKGELSVMAPYLSELMEGYSFYPILYYFRFERMEYALPRIMTTVLDSVSLIATVLDTRRYRKVLRSPAAEELWCTGMHLVENLSAAFLPKKHHPDKYAPTPDAIRQWRKHFLSTVKRLLDEEVETAADLKQAEERYIELRSQWNPYVLAFSDALLYHREEIFASGDVPGKTEKAFPAENGERDTVKGHSEERLEEEMSV